MILFFPLGPEDEFAPKLKEFEDDLSARCQRQFKFDPFGYEFGNLNLTPHLLNITHAW